ncbi:MAG: hypothetical protein EOP00_04920 [Pedobacter sp.]|nr:MAG: hypothetical protein EOP00_04920 [Pedobacter sp.]
MRFYKKSIILMPLLLLILLSSVACRKKTQEIADPIVPPPVINPIPTLPIPPPPIQQAPSLEVGTGSGNLTIDGNSLDLSVIKLLLVKPGTYQSITVKNINGTATAPIVIKNNGVVNVSSSIQTDNVSNLTISGNHVAGVNYGFTLENIPYRAMVLLNKANAVTIEYVSFKNVKDYAISGNTNDLAYNGTAVTRTEGLKIMHCLFDNSGPIAFGGNLDKNSNKDTGFYKEVEISYNTFQNTNWGKLCVFTNVQDYNIHHNIVNNVNTTNNEHNGIFFMLGNGDFHDNKLTNYQGNAIRMWLYSRGGSATTNEIYNNICFNTRKYSAFEVQSFDMFLYPGKSTFANVKVFNNTVGQMNTSKDWEGQILDVYSIPGTIEYYNNLGFNLNTTGGKSITNMIDFQGVGKVLKDENNKYFQAQASAVANTNTFASLVQGIGAPAQ